MNPLSSILLVEDNTKDVGLTPAALEDDGLKVLRHAGAFWAVLNELPSDPQGPA